MKVGRHLLARHLAEQVDAGAMRAQRMDFRRDFQMNCLGMPMSDTKSCPPFRVRILVATANRPHYLKAALESVAAQADDVHIEVVLVSENGGNRESQKISDGFRDRLPIEYLFRSPALDPVAHVLGLFAMEGDSPVAFLCDDDWWFEGHLRGSLRALSAVPGASAVFSASAFVASEKAKVASIYRPETMVSAAGETDFLSPWTLSFEKVCAAAWLETPFHFSTMVARASALRIASERTIGSHPNFTDKLLEVRLAEQGAIVFRAQPSVGIRIHEKNWAADKSSKLILETDRQAAALIESISAEAGNSCWGFWRSKMPSIPPESRGELARRFLWIHGKKKLEAQGFDRLFYDRRTRWMLRDCAVRLGPVFARWIPPVVAQFARRSIG